MTPPAEAQWADRGWYLALEFQQSSSGRFDRALELAGKSPGFAVLIDESGTCVYRTLYREKELRHLPRLLTLVSGWKNTRIYIRGVEIDAASVDAWLACYLSRARLPVAPCREPLRATNPAAAVGCYFAGISLRLSDWDGWYRHAQADEQGVFHLDKEGLRARIASWENLYAHCPLADAGILHRVVDLLPDRIDPRTDPRWRVTHDPYAVSRQLAIMPRSASGYTEFLREHLGPILT